jgi:hypothetical protein
VGGCQGGSGGSWGQQIALVCEVVRRGEVWRWGCAALPATPEGRQGWAQAGQGQKDRREAALRVAATCLPWVLWRMKGQGRVPASDPPPNDCIVRAPLNTGWQVSANQRAEKDAVLGKEKGQGWLPMQGRRAEQLCRASCLDKCSGQPSAKGSAAGQRTRRWYGAL